MRPLPIFAIAAASTDSLRAFVAAGKGRLSKKEIEDGIHRTEKRPMKTILLAGMAALAIMTSAANASCPSSLSPADHFDCRMKEIDREQREEARNQILRDQADAMREQADAMREQNRILEQAERQRQLDSFLSRPFPTYQFR